MYTTTHTYIHTYQHAANRICGAIWTPLHLIIVVSQMLGVPGSEWPSHVARSSSKNSDVSFSIGMKAFINAILCSLYATNFLMDL